MNRTTSTLNLRPGTASQRGIFALPDDHVWCGAVEPLPQGGYFMAYSHWPFRFGFDAWVSHSRIGLAVSESLLGPYRHEKLLLGPEQNTPPVQHNPALLYWKGEYVLYFTGNSGPWSRPEAPPTENIHMDRLEWWEHRNNQRVWMATTRNPLGEWHVQPAPLFEPEPDYLTTGTPFAFVRLDGQIQIVVKTVRTGPPPRGGRVEHHTFLADHPAGPFRKVGDCLLPDMKTEFPIDDHCQFCLGDRYYAVIKDHGEGLTEDVPALLLLESSDGRDWQLAPDPLVTRFRLGWEDGSVRAYERLEMPRVLFVRGVPVALQLSAYAGDEAKSFNLRLPLSSTANNSHVS